MHTVEKIALKTGLVSVRYLGFKNIGKCYHQYSYLVESEGVITDRDIDELQQGGHVGFGMELEIDYQKDGSVLIIRRVDSGG